MKDFAPLKTFTVRDARVTSSRPELGNALFAMQVHDAIRDALAAKGLKGTIDHHACQSSS
jgi:hypothetical protein